MNRRIRAGLTLLELLVVLVILAIVATVALQSLEPQVRSQRLQSSTRQLDELRLAILGPTGKYQLDGTPLTSGFVSDVGRLPIGSQAPIASPLDSGTPVATLDELWNPDSALAVQFPFQFRKGPEQPVDYSIIKLPCGWRGPYLQLPAGAPRIVDAWGRPLKLLSLDDGQISDLIIELPESIKTGNVDRFSVSLARGRAEVTGTLLLDSPDAAEVTVALLTPDPKTSLTTLRVIADEDSQPDTFSFQDVPIGVRAVVADVGGQRQIKYVQVLQTGANLIFDFRRKPAPN